MNTEIVTKGAMSHLEKLADMIGMNKAEQDGRIVMRGWYSQEQQNNNYLFNARHMVMIRGVLCSSLNDKP